MNSAERGKELRHRRHEQGLCTRCKSPATLKADGTPTLLCAKCRAKKNADRESRRRADAKMAREMRDMGIKMEDLTMFIGKTDTADAKSCVCGGVYYAEYSFCPWCGRKIKSNSDSGG